TPLEVVADHVVYLADRLGVDHVGLGSDFDGCLPPQDLSDVTGLPLLFEVLRQRGFDETALDKLAYRNWISMLEKAAA
ncbi:MAG: membrane dipeptidase, partial [Pseudomonadota bacterium]